MLSNITFGSTEEEILKTFGTPKTIDEMKLSTSAGRFIYFNYDKMKVTLDYADKKVFSISCSDENHSGDGGNGEPDRSFGCAPADGTAKTHRHPRD